LPISLGPRRPLTPVWSTGAKNVSAFGSADPLARSTRTIRHLSDARLSRESEYKGRNAWGARGKTAFILD
jgi:hypothetical protein